MPVVKCFWDGWCPCSVLEQSLKGISLLPCSHVHESSHRCFGGNREATNVWMVPPQGFLSLMWVCCVDRPIHLVVGSVEDF